MPERAARRTARRDRRLLATDYSQVSQTVRELKRRPMRPVRDVVGWLMTRCEASKTIAETVRKD